MNQLNNKVQCIGCFSFERFVQSKQECRQTVQHELHMGWIAGRFRNHLSRLFLQETPLMEKVASLRHGSTERPTSNDQRLLKLQSASWFVVDTGRCVSITTVDGVRFSTLNAQCRAILDQVCVYLNKNEMLINDRRRQQLG